MDHQPIPRILLTPPGKEFRLCFCIITSGDESKPFFLHLVILTDTPFFVTGL